MAITITAKESAQGVVDEYSSGRHDMDGLRDLIQIAITVAVADAYQDAARIADDTGEALRQDIGRLMNALRSRQVEVLNQ